MTNNNLTNFFQSCSLEPTRIVSNNRPSLLDNIFINTHDKEVYSGNIIDNISDHMPNFAIIKRTSSKNRQNCEHSNSQLLFCHQICFYYLLES